MQATNSNLLNTPLANTMKKVGMTPLMNKSLNNFVVKKGNNNNMTHSVMGSNSPSLMLNRDGTGGPQTNTMFT